MPEKITWSLNVQVAGGPKILASKTLDVDAYDMIQVSVGDGANGAKVDVQPGDTGVQLLLISSDQYGADLTYSVNAAESDAAKRIKLDALQLLLGVGAVGLLKDPPKSLFFYNALSIAASIQILVGRDATP
jgi:hypothetical protein